jgi:LysM repeat protein
MKALNRLRLSQFSPQLLLTLGFAVFALAILGLVALFASYILFTFSDSILPHIKVGDVDLGRLTVSQAAEKLANEWNGRSIVISDGTTYWVVPAADMGLSLDSQATAQEAYKLGRGMNGPAQAFSVIFGNPMVIMPEVTFLQDVSRSSLNQYALLAGTPAVDATLQFQDGAWSAQPGRSGLGVDIESALIQLQANRALVMVSQFFELPMATITPRSMDLSTSLQAILPLLNTPMSFTAFDPITGETTSWTIPPETFAPWLQIINQDKEPAVSINSDSLAAYLTGWQSNLGDGRIFQPSWNTQDLLDSWKAGGSYSLTIWHQPSSYTIQAGDTLTAISIQAQMPYWKILDANPGLDMNNLPTGITITIPSKNEMLPLPFIRNKRIVISITDQRLWTYENGNLLNEYIISTGIDSSPTLPGVYQVQTHDPNAYASVWDLYMPNFLGIYEGWPGFFNGIHGLPMLSSGVRLWANVLGTKASFGCIILDLPASEVVYNWAEDGVVVEIRP